MFETDCLMMVYFHVFSASEPTTAQSSSNTDTSPTPTGEMFDDGLFSCIVSATASATVQSPSTSSAVGELTVGACHDVTGIVFCLSVQALIQYH